MGRPTTKTTAPVAAVQILPEAAHAIAQAQTLEAKMVHSYGEDRDLLNQLLGQAQMADSFAKFSKTVFTSKLAFVKENKLYQALKGSKGENGIQFSGTWEEFCNALGWTPQHANDAIASLNAFGEEALESMSRMGIGYREMRQYRKLPEDQKLALIEVAKAGDKESFVDLAEEIIARHAKEKEALAAQVQESEELLEAKDRMLTEKNERIDLLVEQTTRKFKPRQGSEARTADEQALLDELDEGSNAAFLAMHRTFKAADAALADGSASAAVQGRARQAIEFLAQQLADMAEEFGIQVDLEARFTPPWLDEAALAVMEARNGSKAGEPANLPQ